MDLLPRLRKLSEWRGIKIRTQKAQEPNAPTRRESWDENGWSFRPRDIGNVSAASRRRRQFTGIIQASDVKALFGGVRKSRYFVRAIAAFVILDLLLCATLIYWFLK